MLWMYVKQQYLVLCCELLHTSCMAVLACNWDVWVGNEWVRERLRWAFFGIDG